MLKTSCCLFYLNRGKVFDTLLQDIASKFNVWVTTDPVAVVTQAFRAHGHAAQKGHAGVPDFPIVAQAASFEAGRAIARSPSGPANCRTSVASSARRRSSASHAPPGGVRTRCEVLIWPKPSARKQVAP